MLNLPPFKISNNITPISQQIFIEHSGRRIENFMATEIRPYKSLQELNIELAGTQTNYNTEVESANKKSILCS